MSKKIILLFFLPIIFLLFASNVNAQTRTTVLLNKTSDTTKYVFDVKQLPSNSIIPKDGVLLNMNLKVNTLNDNQEQILTINNDNDPIAIGKSSKITNITKSLNIKLNLHDKLPTMANDLIIKTEFSKVNIQDQIFFYSSLSNSKLFEINKQPKLVVNYEVTKEPNHSNWEQANANAQHTNAINWKWEGDFNETNFFPSGFKLNNCLNDKTIIYKENPIVFEKQGNTCQMSLLNQNKKGKLWSMNLLSAPVKYPLIDKKGKMYLFLENNTLMVINLDNQSIIKNIDLNSISFNSNSSSKISINSINDNPTIGYDGTIYLSINNNNGRVGIVALSAYPEFKPRWFYNTTKPVSAIALTENEKFACFIESDVYTKKSKLVVLDNISGDVFAHSDDVLSSYSNDVNYYFPPVVTQKIDTDKTYIYVLNGNKTASKLVVFQINHNTNSTTNKIEIVKTIESSQEDMDKNTGISQPSISMSGNMYFVKDNVLSKFDPKTSKIEPVNCSSYIFSNESEILSSASNQLFIKSNKELCYVNTNLEGYQVLKLNNSLNSTSNLFLTPNLEIIYSSIDNCTSYKLYNIRYNSKDPSVYKDFKNNTVYFNNAIKFQKNTKIIKNTNTILIANRHYLSKGVSVNTGANVSFKIN